MAIVKQPLIVYFKKGFAHALTKISSLSPRSILYRARVRIKRTKSDRYLSQLTTNNSTAFKGTVLVDGLFDNPNYWLRYALVRNALGIKNHNQEGMIGPYNRAKIKKTLAFFNVPVAHDFLTIERAMHEQATQLARALLDGTKDPKDILDWDLPGGVPPGTVYDGLLRRQRNAVVDITHYKFEAHVTEAVASILAARQVIETHNYELLILSHNFDFRWAALVWFGFEKNIPSIMLYGNFGVLKFCRMNCQNDFHHFFDHPSDEDIDRLSPEQADAAAEVGCQYLGLRLSGKTKDLGAVYAFQTEPPRSMKRSAFCQELGWDATKKITAVYAGNWWDNIHGLGMTHFRDLEDWLQCTLDTAAQNKDVNWLIKGHPVDRWYGGTKLSDVLPNSLPQNIQVAPEDWNNTDVISLADGVVTIHGTAGLEFAFSRKPVLLADRGWYHECGFALWSQSREDYISHLLSDWGALIDLTISQRRAEIFAALCCCCPSWQQGLIYRPDTDRDDIYLDLQETLEKNPKALEKEIQTISDWFESSTPYYHVFKMQGADAFALSNVRR